LARFRHLLESLCSPTQGQGNTAFATALGCVCLALVAPFWIGDMTPLTDFGGHLQMVDAAVRLDEVDVLAERLAVREGWLAPNLLPARLAELLAPLATPLEVLRLFLSAVMLGLALALLLCLKVFGRSRHLIFLALPFSWGGMMGLGLINYVGVYPLFFAGIAWAYLAGRDGKRRHLLLLFGVTVLAFYMHGLGFVFVLGFAALSMTLAVDRRRHLWRLLSLLPGTLLWLSWLGCSGGGGGFVERAAKSIKYYDLEAKLGAFGSDGLDVLVGNADGFAFIVLTVAWLAWLLARRPQGEPERKSRFERLRARPLWVMALVAVAFVLLAPTYVGTILVDTRMVTPALILLCLLPRPLASLGHMRLLGAATAVTGLGLGLSLCAAADLFQEREIAPLVDILQELPRGQRAECVGVGKVDSLFKRRPLAHGCNGLIQVQRDGFAGGGFAYTPFNAVYFKSGHGYHSLRRRAWQRSGARKHWDYAVVRGDHKKPHPTLFERIAQRRSSHPLGTSWTLYKILRWERPERASKGL